VAGHSEGSTIAAKLASVFPKVTHLVYSGGNPMGRILTTIERLRAVETDSTRDAEMQFDYWQKVVSDPNNMNANGDTYKVTYDFSIPPIEYLRKLRIPVLISYGTKDAGSPYNDYLRVESITQKKTNFTFKAYIGTEHNYFPVKPNGQIDYDTFNWDKVADDWRSWLLQK
jgi:pimeloyl-ACP methyl ester carboxylesterase